jgi:hypothetical protein
MDAQGLQKRRIEFGLPLRRIIDTVHFAEKADAQPLQLADLCAFVLGRGLKANWVPEYALGTIWRHMQWVAGVSRPEISELSSTGERE